MDDPPRTVTTVCGYCGVGCGLTLRIDGDRVAASTGTPDHPTNRGRLCTKGATTAEMLSAPGRLTTATVDGSRTGIDNAVTETARRLTAIRDEHGPDSVAVYVSGQMTIEAQYLANKLTKGFLGTNQIESNSRLCMASAGTGYKQSLGADGPPGSYDDLDHADLFLVIGSNMADCHPILFLRMMERVKAGARLVVVDPRRTATAAKADLYLPIRPGTDLALLNGLLRSIVESDGVDDEFVAAHTSGWESMAPLLDDYPLDVVAETTGLPVDDLRTLARWIVEADDWMSLWTMGLNQSTHGTWHTNALVNLHLATGTICRTGSGPFSLTGQPNAMGGREMGYMGPGLPGQRTALDAEHRAFTENLWGLPAGTIRDDAGGGTIDMFERMAAGEIRAAWIICTNPVASVANRSTVVAALEAADLVVVQEAFDGAETTAYADIVLPAALWSETDGVMVNSERTLTLCRPALAPPGDARPDWRLIADVATALGFGDAFDYPDASSVFDELSAFQNPTTGWDVRGASHERLRDGPVQWPAAPGCDARNPIRYRDGATLRFPTADGRARFLPRPFLPPAELPDDEYPVLLTTGRLAHQWHTMTKTGRVAKLNKLDPASFAELHPATAAEHGVVDGDRVTVASRRGSVTVPARVTADIAPGCCFVPMHFNDAAGPDLAVNAVTSDAVDPDSLQPEFKACAVSLTPVPAEPVSSPPDSTPQEDPSVTALASVFGGAPTPSTDAAESAYLSGLAAGIAANPPVDAVPVIPATAPLSSAVRAWADGVLAGYFSRSAVAVAAVPTAPVTAGPRLTLVWASQTGTAEEFADRAVPGLTAAGFTVSSRSAAEVGVDELTGPVLFAVSTTGDGDPPDNAIALWTRLTAATSSDVADLRFAVLGFGDSSYADFCGFARKLDGRLELLGADRIIDRVSCEPGDDAGADAWVNTVTEALSLESDQPVETVPPVDYSRRNPLAARLVANQRLSGDSSAKEVRRFAFELPPDTLTYQAGDALGVVPTNSPALVDEWLAVTNLDGDLPVDAAGDTMPLRTALAEHFEIARITRDLVGFVADRHDDPHLRSLLEHRDAFDEWVWGRQSVDLLAEYPVDAEIADWLTVLRPLQPRLYSISSSPVHTPDRVEVTVSAVRFDAVRFHAGEVRRGGVCSTYLADAPDTTAVRVFVQPNKHFAPPTDPTAPMIMIGPGTGIAPFRGFLHERAATGAVGDNWLFFGEQHRATDFLYEEELTELHDAGVLTRLDVAFSRDQADKVYVQDLMRQHAADVWEWLSRGAYVYVCGDASKMARDVDDALHQIVAEQGRLAPRSADAYVVALAAEHRYVRDVY
ncbi:bifunctional nitrate reductase/sulfite reductase flavoprotein subunit alpha [Gordonia sp. HY442]|uniref:bifunctional nitrate reductase/sulfite reductase flavoprotein subunit alpha n=1 Tax=Gordonia zhenghanii TaxID=2911516 RepID=UPI001F397529|nr:bifunctional nitrate reductase/sulfite reductase flavoprotein subunit alpha [Gordonia zhenghanii]MCF8603349.1 bifunctional nitrate reductase/sulfite reductase flavoprotein subunit alpha [Gordonia zhenghanii]